MKSVTAKRLIEASLDRVFETVADIRNYSRAVPHITNIEFLTEQQTGVGTRFRETRIMNGREAQTELEVTEYVENDHIRLVADAGGTIWDSLFEIRRATGGVELTLQMDARAYKLLAKLFNPLIRRMVVGGIEKDMDAVKEYCERNGAGSSK